MSRDQDPSPTAEQTRATRPDPKRTTISKVVSLLTPAGHISVYIAQDRVTSQLGSATLTPLCPPPHSPTVSPTPSRQVELQSIQHLRDRPCVEQHCISTSRPCLFRLLPFRLEMAMAWPLPNHGATMRTIGHLVHTLPLEKAGP